MFRCPVLLNYLLSSEFRFNGVLLKAQNPKKELYVFMPAI